MNRVAQVIPSVLGNTLLPQLDYAALKAAGIVVPEFEQDATEDYCFDIGADSLRSRIGGGLLTKAGVDPVYQAGFATLPAGTNGLMANTPDQPVFTMAAVIRRPAANPAAAFPLIGSELPAASPTSGIGIYMGNTGNLVLRARPSGANGAAASGAVIAAGSWMFVAVVSAQSPALNQVFVGAPTPLVGTSDYSHTVNGVPLAVGKARTLGAGYNEMDTDVHRLTIWAGRALTTAQLTEAYKRAKVDAGRRGIVVV